MIETPGGPHEISCADAALLVEKGVLEQPLSDKERHTVDHHLNHCPPCRDFVQWTSGLPRIADVLLEQDLDSAVSAIVQNRQVLQRVESRKKMRWTAYVAAASIAAITLVGFVVSAILSNRPAVDLKSFQCSPAHPTEPVAGVFMTYCDQEQPGTLIENGGDVRISLQSGTVGLLIDPARPHRHRVTVETPQGEVRVKGTVFAVHVDEEGAWVEVFRGVVEVVSSERDENAIFVSAGNGAVLDTRKKFKLSAPKSGVLLETLRVAASVDTAGLGIGERDSEHQRGNEGVPEMSAAVDSGTPADPIEQAASTDPTHQGAGSVTKRSVPSIDALIQEAQSCLLIRDWNCAAAQYQEALKHYSGRSESTPVLISLAKIELRHLNAPKKALAHYRSYQQYAPDGPLAEEALFGIAAAYRRLGVEVKETETLRQFISKYPQSSLLEKARTRLEQLGAVEAL